MAVLSERVLLIANPGSRRGARLVEPARQAFRAAGVEADVIVTEGPGHGARVAREGVNTYEKFFTLGGDGTVMEVVQALAGSGRAVGILPAGTGNLLARALHIPLDVRRAIPLLLRGTARRIDLGVLGDGRRFAVAAGIGIDADMIAGAPLALRQRYGVLAYFGTATASLARLTPFAMRGVVDGKVIERDDCVLAMIVNVSSVLGGLFELAPHSRYDDGKLDLCVFSTRGIAGGAVIAARLAFKSHRQDRHMAFAQGTHITLDTTVPRGAEADGELIGNTPLAATVDPLAAPLLVPLARS